MNRRQLARWPASISLGNFSPRSKAVKLPSVVAAIAVIALEALLGIACPLTVWEDLLRGSLQPQTFVGRWVQRLLYYNAPEELFTTLYLVWALATLATLRFVPPRKRAG